MKKNTKPNTPIMETKTEDICCPLIQPSDWEDQRLVWNQKRFIKSRVFTLWYMPLNFGSVMKKLDQKVTAAGGKSGPLCLSDHSSKWNMDLYLEVDREIPGVENTFMSGNYFSKVYEGPFKETGNWWTQFMASIKAKGYKIGRTFMWYTVCPKCAKKYGKNYTVILGQIAE